MFVVVIHGIFIKAKDFLTELCVSIIDINYNRYSVYKTIGFIFLQFFQSAQRIPTFHFHNPKLQFPPTNFTHIIQ